MPVRLRPESFSRGFVSRAAFLQAHGRSRKETAAIIGVAPETISVWKRHPQWQVELERWRELAEPPLDATELRLKFESLAKPEPGSLCAGLRTRWSRRTSGGRRSEEDLGSLPESAERQAAGCKHGSSVTWRRRATALKRSDLYSRNEHCVRQCRGPRACFARSLAPTTGSIPAPTPLPSLTAGSSSSALTTAVAFGPSFTFATRADGASETRRSQPSCPSVGWRERAPYELAVAAHVFCERTAVRSFL
jgi:hypothetical protein